MTCQVEKNSMMHVSSHDSSLLYDEINNAIFDINESKNKDNYKTIESLFNLNLISENTKCKSCKNHYSFIKCKHCKNETCGEDGCCTLFPDYNGYISICKKCEKNINRKLIPYIDAEDDEDKKNIILINKIMRLLR